MRFNWEDWNFHLHGAASPEGPTVCAFKILSSADKIGQVQLSIQDHFLGGSKEYSGD